MLIGNLVDSELGRASPLPPEPPVPGPGALALRSGWAHGVPRTCLCELSHLAERVVGEERQGV